MTNRRNQPRLIGKRRLPVGSAFEKPLERAIKQEQIRWNASRSFIIAWHTANSMGVKLSYDYKT